MSAQMSADELAQFERRIGQLALRLPCVSVFARHTRPRYTLDYVHPEDMHDDVSQLAAAYLQDLLRMRSPDIVAKWFVTSEDGTFEVRAQR